MGSTLEDLSPWGEVLLNCLSTDLKLRMEQKWKMAEMLPKKVFLYIFKLLFSSKLGKNIWNVTLGGGSSIHHEIGNLLKRLI